MRALATRAPARLHPDTFRRETYAPGPVRCAADNEHAAVAAFVDRHPEYASLSHLELVTLAATYVGPEVAAEHDALEDAGVPLDWHRADDGEAL